MVILKADGAIIANDIAQMATHPTAAVAGLRIALATLSRLNLDIRIPTDLVTAMAAIDKRLA